MDDLATMSMAMLAPPSDDASRWQAVISRDPFADGIFVYAVRTTRIYCRPICKARLARRENVRFYTTPEEARTAGFRACKRCKPERAGLMPEEDAIQKIREYVARQERQRPNSTADPTSLSKMARDLGLSKWHFHRAFKKCTGVTPVEYARMRRRGEQSPISEDTTAVATPDTESSPDELFSGVVVGELGLDLLDPSDMQELLQFEPGDSWDYAAVLESKSV